MKHMKRMIIPLLAALVIATAFTACEQPENEVEVFEWGISASLAKHSKGDEADHGNWQGISYLALAGNKIEIEADETKMEEYLSSDPFQQDAPHKWFAILIGTGDDDIRNISYNNVKLTDKDIQERDAMLKSNGTPADDDEFVLWLNTENADGYRFMLNRANASTVTITVEYTNKGALVESLPQGNITTVNSMIKAAFASFENLESGTRTFTSGSYDGSADLTVDGDGWILHVAADLTGSKKAAHNVEFTITSKDIAEDNTIEVAIAGKTYTTSAKGLMNGVVIPGKPAPYEAPSNEEVKTQLEAFFAEFGKVQGWDHGLHSQPLYIDSEDLAGFNGWNADVSAYIDFGRYPETVDSIKMLGTDFTADTEMQVSIGSNVFYKDAGWKMDEDGHLLVNKLFMFTSLTFDEEFRINGESLGYDLGYGISASLDTENWWEMEAQENRYAAIEELGDGEYDVTVSTMNKPLYSSYSGQSDTDIILAVTDYMESGETTRQLALLTGEADQFISYFYGWRDTYEESVEKLMTVNPRDVKDRAVVLASDGTIKGTYENIYHVSSAYIGAEDLPSVYGYLENPAHERIFNRLGGIAGSSGGPISIEGHSFDGKTLTIDVVFGDGVSGFEYQKGGTHAASGEIRFMFSGSSSGDTFKAGSWKISTEGLSIDDEHTFSTDGFGGMITSDGALGTTAATADFGLSGNDWDGTVKNPAEACFGVALGLEGAAEIDGKIVIASMLSSILG